MCKTAYKIWFRACRLLVNQDSAKYQLHLNSSIGLEFRHGSIAHELNGVRRINYTPTAHVYAIVTLSEATAMTGKSAKRCAIHTARHYRIHGSNRHCPIPA
ncbi:hypothetical protein [Methylobacterium sp. Leaf87]|uniref:hypothetical protein n=1 Tax=Methylobacterium sp. Leaf87 TaxID=1736243 RepID=UPI000A450B48|nr:hypothetical protein [Methylobacterium sp. Leaf87]